MSFIKRKMLEIYLQCVTMEFNELKLLLGREKSFPVLAQLSSVGNIESCTILRALASSAPFVRKLSIVFAESFLPREHKIACFMGNGTRRGKVKYRQMPKKIKFPTQRANICFNSIRRCE